MNTKSIIKPLAFIAALLGLSAFLEARAQNVIKMTGVRFAYPLVEHWIDEYNKVNPNVQIVIEWRGTQDPSQYDILVEAYEQSEEIKKERDYFYIARYAILPVANSASAFAKTYSVKGLTTQTIKQIFFHDLFADKDKEQQITAPYTTYTRLQKAGAPMVFASYFKYEQKDITGKGIAGSDEHLLKAVLRDSAGVSYLPTPVIYGQPSSGLVVIPVDLNGNDRVSDDEKFYDNWSNAFELLSKTKNIHNVPTEQVHLSVDKKTAKPEAVAFIHWVIENRQADLKTYGFLSPLNSQHP
jgi:ABC-type phosphate transport system substrate-binding protein